MSFNINQNHNLGTVFFGRLASTTNLTLPYLGWGPYLNRIPQNGGPLTFSRAEALTERAARMTVPCADTGE